MAVLQRVVHPPYHPHARDVVIRDVAVYEKITRALLAPAAAALVLDIKGLGRANRLRVHAGGGLGNQLRPLGQSGVEGRILRSGLSAPPNRPAMLVVDVKYLRASMYQPLLDRVSQVGTRDRSCGVAEGV